jgi:RNA polymerase-binding protein DksA
MDQRDLNYFKERLLNMRREILKHMKGIQEEEQEATLKESTGENSSYSFHLADQGSNTYDQDNHFRSLERDCHLLYFIDQALEKIEESGYGHCEECGNPIGRARLKAIPYASFCVDCQSKQEGSSIQGLDYFEQTPFPDDNWELF